MSLSLIYTIDDDLDFNMMLELALKPYNISVKTHSTVASFTESVKMKIPDACIVDFNLDKLMGEGFQLVKAIRNVIGKELPIFVMSRRGDKADVDMAIALGANDFIPKPLDDTYLLTKLKHFLPENILLSEVEILLAIVGESKNEMVLTTSIYLKEVSLTGIIVESDAFFAKESLIYCEGALLNDLYGKAERMSFKVLDSWTIDGGRYGAKLETEITKEQYFSKRRWLCDLND